MGVPFNLLPPPPQPHLLHAFVKKKVPGPRKMA